jgi:Acetyltransferase (GNAT) family.
VEEKIRTAVSKATGINFKAKFSGDDSIPVLDLEIQDHYSGEGFYCTLNLLHLPPEMREKGIGTKVMQAFISACQKNGVHTIGLHAFPYSYGEGNTLEDIRRLIRFYEKFGFALQDEAALEEVFQAESQKWDEGQWDGRLAFSEIGDASWMELDL